MASLHAQRGGSCSIVLTENMFSSSCIIQHVSTAVFFLSVWLHRSWNTCSRLTQPIKTLLFDLNNNAVTVLILLMGRMGCRELPAVCFKAKTFKTSQNSLTFYVFKLQKGFYENPNQEVRWHGAEKQHKTDGARGLNFLTTLESKTTLCPMNEDRNLRLSHTTEEKNNPGVSSNEEKTELFLSTDVFTMRTKCNNSHCNIFSSLPL